MLDIMSKGQTDFAPAWSKHVGSCDITSDGTPMTALEMTAYKVSQYTDNDINTLYEICLNVDPEDPYNAPDFLASSEQIPEVQGALVLCPTHPYSRTWKAAVQRGLADEALRKQGRLFDDGTYLVGKDIQPGTYVTTDVTNCYWERQDRNGGIIDNNFILSARRVQVTIRSTDYGFHADGCGEWRPA